MGPHRRAGVMNPESVYILAGAGYLPVPAPFIPPCLGIDKRSRVVDQLSLRRPVMNQSQPVICRFLGLWRRPTSGPVSLRLLDRRRVVALRRVLAPPSAHAANHRASIKIRCG